MAARIDTSSLTTLHYAGIALAAVSGVIHLVLGVGSLPTAFGVSFLVAAAGFAAGIAMVALNVRRRLAYLVGVPFVLGQVVIFGYTVIQGLNQLSPVAAVDKLVQLALVAILVVLLSRE